MTKGRYSFWPVHLLPHSVWIWLLDWRHLRLCLTDCLMYIASSPLYCRSRQHIWLGWHDVTVLRDSLGTGTVSWTTIYRTVHGDGVLRNRAGVGKCLAKWSDFGRNVSIELYLNTVRTARWTQTISVIKTNLLMYREICCLIYKEIREELWVIFPSVHSRALSGSSDRKSAGAGNSRFGKMEGTSGAWGMIKIRSDFGQGLV